MFAIYYRLPKINLTNGKRWSSGLLATLFLLTGSFPLNQVASAASNSPVAIFHGPGGANKISKAPRAAFVYGTGDVNSIYSCQLDNFRWEACRSGAKAGFGYYNMTNGPHTFRVKARYAGLPDGPTATYTWTAAGESLADFIPGDISSDGQAFAVETNEPGMVKGDTNNHKDVFVGWTNRGYLIASRSTTGVQANGPSWGPRMDDSGMRVAYSTTSTNLVGDDTNGVEDVVIRDISKNTLERITSSTGTQIGPANATRGAAATRPSVSANGTKVAYVTNYGPSSPLSDVYVYDINVHKTTQYIGRGDNPSISKDGTYVAYQTLGAYAGQSNPSSIIIKNTVSGNTKVASLDDAGNSPLTYFGNPATSIKPDISADGNHVAFETNGILTSKDQNNHSDIYVYDSTLNKIKLISVTYDGTSSITPNGSFAANGGSYAPSIRSTPQGSSTVYSVAFETDATNYGTIYAENRDNNGKRDVVMWTGTTNSTFTSSNPMRIRLFSVSSLSTAGNASNGTAKHARVSPDGNFVLYQSNATDSYRGSNYANHKTLMRGLFTPPGATSPASWSAGVAGLMMMANFSATGGDDEPDDEDDDNGGYFSSGNPQHPGTGAIEEAEEDAKGVYDDCIARLGPQNEDICLEAYRVEKRKKIKQYTDEDNKNFPMKVAIPVEARNVPVDMRAVRTYCPLFMAPNSPPITWP